MKKSLLLLSAIAVTLSAQAESHIYIKHNNVMIPNHQNSGKDLRTGNALWYEPSATGSIEEYDKPFVAVANGDGAAVGDYGFQFETRTWVQDTPEAECIKADEVILAFDYKVNYSSQSVSIYNIDLDNGGVLNGGGCNTGGSVLTVSDEWQTCYLLDTDRPAYIGVAGEMAKNNAGEQWFWIRINDRNHIVNPDFRIEVKCPRFLTLDEAKAAVEDNFNPNSEIGCTFTPANDGFIGGFDSDYGYNLYEVRISQDDTFNPLMRTNSMLYSLPSSLDTFAFDYQTTGNITMNVYFQTTGMQIAATNITLSDEYEFAGDEWGTFTVNLKDAIQQYNFAQTFATGHYIVLQVPPASRETAAGNLLFLENPRWTNEKNLSGIEDIDVDNAEGPVTYYNLQGVKVNNPEAGLYIKRQGNTTTKVLVK